MAAIPRNQDLIRELFDRALERPAAERAEFVDDACRGNVDLRAELTSLLKLHEEAGSALRDPSGPVSEQPGERIGHYRLLQRIGEGGFGTVWMAEQQEPVRRKVALKVLKAGMDTAQVVARFEAERQALALMDHPHIAQVFDGGSTPGGRPYFVMELVRGVPITRYCDEAGLSPRERLELFIPVCQAVQHAHFKGVIHRDIKPTNVLVTLHDGRPVPKVIDFGIAKAVQGRLTERTLFTEFQQMLDTPEYMAPEQAEMSALDVDTRADVYSLGVLLYELLTGTRPFDFRTLLEAGFAEVLRTIKEVDPPKPSTRVSTLGDQLVGVAKQRRMHPRALGPLMRGDLDWIVMRTLEKERNRRYATPAALAEDVQRYLRDEPVEAGPPSRLYRLRKYVQRHRLGVGSGAAIALAVCAGSAAAGWGWLRASDEAHAARIQTAKVARLVELHEEMLGSGNPKHFHGPDYTVRQLLEDYEKELGADLAGEPEVEIQLRRTIAKTFLDLGLLEQAAKQARRIRGLLARLPGASVAPTPTDLILEANICSANGRFAEALALLDALDARPGESSCSEEMLSRARNIRKTCQINLGQFEQARQTIREALEIHRRMPDEDGVVHAMVDLAELDTLSGRLQSADQVFREVALLVEQGKYFPCVEVHYQLGHASVKRLLLREDEAVQLAEKGLARCRELYGDSAVDTARALQVTGQTLAARGDFAAAARRLEEALRIISANFGESHPETASCLMWLARATTDLGSSERYARRALEIDRQVGHENSVIAADHRTILARILMAQGRHDEAEESELAALAVYSSLLDEQDTPVQNARFVLAQILRRRGALDEAERLLRELLPNVQGEDAPLLAEVWQELGRVMLDKDAPAEAVVDFERSLSALERVGARSSGMAAWTLHHLADARWDLGERAESRRLNAESRALFAQADGPDDPGIAEAAECLAKKLTDPAEREEAEGLLREALRIRIATGELEKSAENCHKLGHLLIKRRDMEGAEREFRAGLEHVRGAGVMESHLGVELCIDLGGRLRARGDKEGAERHFRAALETVLRVGSEASAIAPIRDVLATTLEEGGDLLSAEEQRRELVAIHRVLGREGAADEKLASTLGGLATNLVRQGRHADAEPVLREALELERADADPVRVAAVLVRLGACLLELQRAAQAVPLLEEGLALRIERTPDDWKRYEAASWLGAAYLACNERERAEPLLVEAASKIEPPVSLASRRRDAIERLIALYEASARPEDAATWRRKLDELPAR